MDRSRNGVQAGSGMKGKLCASLTVEAAMAFALFLFAVIAMALPMDMLNTHRRVEFVLEQTARELSQNAYLLHGGRMHDDPGKQQEEQMEERIRERSDPSLLSIVEDAAVQAYLYTTIQKRSGNHRIEALDLTKCHLTKDGEWVDLKASYRYRIPFGIFPNLTVPFCARSRHRGWIGSDPKREKDGEEAEEDRIVYVGRDSTRYHLSPRCHYLNHELKPISRNELESARSGSGSTYRPCDICGKKGSSGTVYILPNGEKYHTDPDCSSLRSYIREVWLSEVRNLGACSYCGGG